MTTKKAATEQVITIPALDIRTATIKIVGDSPLIMHKWAEKAKKEILDKQMKKAKSKGHDAKDPFADFIGSMYWLDGEPENKTPEVFAKAIENGARFGFPATAIKAAAYLGCMPYYISLMARDAPEKLPFPVFRSGNRTKIPREGFIRWAKGEKA